MLLLFVEKDLERLLMIRYYYCLVMRVINRQIIRLLFLLDWYQKLKVLRLQYQILYYRYYQQPYLSPQSLGLVEVHLVFVAPLWA